jgi:DNA-binding response OmpR family regulator
MTGMGVRVQLAEDEPNIVETLTFLLERAGFEVSTDGDGERALAAALAEPPAVLILDVMLPSLDGFEVLRRLRADARGRDVPVIMLTARGLRADRASALGCGADVFLTKPFSNAEVIDAVRRMTGAESLAASRA